MVCTGTSEELIINIQEGSVRHRCGQAPPARSPVSLEQLLATQNDLMRRLAENNERCGAECHQPRHQERDLSYSDFLATHSPVFADAINPLEADS
jgi:hypothetical protein